MKDKQQAERLLNETFNTNFDRDRFNKFIKEIFNKIEIAPVGLHVGTDYINYIKSFQRIGNYIDDSKKAIDVLVVELNKETIYKDRARTKQRNLIAKYLDKNNKDAALVAFYGDDPQDWRFSFVKMEYQLAKDGSISKDLTPAKRSSFLVGVNEPNHTCRKQFLNLVMEEGKNPSLEDIEESFGIENVTKEFFSEYKELFNELKESLEKVIEKDQYVKKEFDDKNISPVDFSKKLLGQIVFIYFLQKKGWLGVGKNPETGKFRAWGSGPKNFLRKLFDKEIVQYDNFFNDILEPLFYEALATERDDDYYSRFNCKIPFLNGGLFEPINDYDWKGPGILLENSIFESILKVFDTFNFTVKEDEPLDKEVAVDPEMLGKVFENLLDVKDRKSKGAFYTPREIVHYMCKQSLINYLGTNTGIPINDIETFIQYGDLAQQLTSKSDIYEKYLPVSIKENSNKIDTLLKNIKIVDPAVGSGAFPMGMMNEIVKARSNLSWLSHEDKPNNYDLKRETIENCLYGVDIDSSAVDIAKLRFWLSLIVDESDMTKIKPLPNLDHKIMCGNSLLEEFEGVKLFDEKLLEEIPKDDSSRMEQIKREMDELHQELGEIYTGKKKDNGRKAEIEKELKKLERKKRDFSSMVKEETQQYTIDQVLQHRIKESRKKLVELRKLQKDFFKEESKKTKKELADKIDKIEWELIQDTLKEEGNEAAMQKLQQYKKNKSKPFFLWKLYFSEVFQREKPGFDVVIANPPYVGHKGGHKEFFQETKLSSLGKRFNNERMDIFYYFFHIALDVGRENSEIAFITTNYYITADSAIKLRTDLKDRANIRKLINFNELKIFESALGQHNLITLITKKNNKDLKCDIYSTQRNGIADYKILKEILSKKDNQTEYYSSSQSDLYDGDKNYIRILNNFSKNIDGINKILDKIKFNSTTLLNVCNISQGIVTGLDKVSKKHIKKLPDLNLTEGDGCYILNHKEKSKFGDSSIIKPWFKNSDISKYKTNQNNSQWLIHLNTDIDIEKYEGIFSHLSKLEKAIKSRNFDSGELSKAFKLNKWWALSSARKDFDFTVPKIVSPQRSYLNTFGYNDIPWYASADVYFITEKSKIFDLKYILGLLNSKLYYVRLCKNYFFIMSSLPNKTRFLI
ncbi:MAG: Eco57I restriction-modification methylase domain-containing protein [Candidatus Methanoperedenaceae archaeon]|nr:Eco57I restriction-modification methylase domain-containing protein [Candidatus Methanoperedenaceae archaeon]